MNLQPRKPLVPWLHQKKSGQQVEGGDSLYALVRLHLDCRIQPLGPQYNKDMLEQVQRKAMKDYQRVGTSLLCSLGCSS